MEEKNLNSPVEELDLNEILRIRREKLDALKSAGKNPYPQAARAAASNGQRP